MSADSAKDDLDPMSEPNRLIAAGNSSLVQLILGTAPWTGGVGAVLSNVAAKRQEIRIQAFLARLAERVLELERGVEPQEIDYDFVHTDAFLGVLVGVLDEAGQSSDDDRLRYLQDFLLASAKRKRPDVKWLDLFQRYLPRLSGAHILVLEAIYRLQSGYAASDRLGSQRLANVPLSPERLGIDAGIVLVRICLNDLENLGLLADWRLLSNTGQPQTEYSMTRNGLLFMRFIKRDWREAPGVEPID